MEKYSLGGFRNQLWLSAEKARLLDKELAEFTERLEKGEPFETDHKLLLVAKITELDETLSKLRTEIMILAASSDMHEEHPLHGEGLALARAMWKKRRWWDGALRNFMKRYFPEEMN